MLRVMDLFSGIGGFSLGLKKAGGFRTVAYCEIDPYCQKVLQARMSDGSLDTAPICSDITKLDGRPWGGAVDCITGGFPCQDISVAGKGGGIDGEASGLWREFARLIGEIRPLFALVENSAALLGRGLERVLGDLAEIGYDAQWRCLEVLHFGLPHLRNRIYLLAYPMSHGLQGCVQRNAKGSGSRDIHAQIFSPLPLCGGKENDLPPPYVTGTNDGIPNRMDRIGALGNAVANQVIAWIGQRILERQT